MKVRKNAALFAVAAVTVLLQGCGGGSSGASSSSTPSAYTISATVSGLNDSGLVLQNNNGNDLAVSAAGTVQFVNTLASGASYSISIKSQPASQSCAVSNGSGTVTNINVSDITVSCINRLTTDAAPTGQAGLMIVAGYQASSGTLQAASTSNLSQFLYVPNSSTGKVTEFRIDPVDGSLQELMGSPFQSSASTSGVIVTNLVIAPDGLHAYLSFVATSSTQRLYSLAINDGYLSEVAATAWNGNWPTAISLGRGGTLAYVEYMTTSAPPFHAGLYGLSINNTSGVTSPVPNTPTSLVGTATVAAGNATWFFLGPSLFSKAGTNLFVSQVGSVEGFQIDGTGQLTPLNGSPFPTSTPDFGALTFDRSQKFIIRATGGVNVLHPQLDVFTVASNGQMTLVAGSPYAAGTGGVSGACVGSSYLRYLIPAIEHPSERYVYTAQTTTECIGPSLTSPGVLLTPVYTNQGIFAYAFNATQGTLSLVPGSPFAANDASIGPLVMHLSGDFLYRPGIDGSTVYVYRIDSNSGAITPVAGSPFGTPSSGSRASRLVLDPTSSFLYLYSPNSGNVYAFAINSSTGALTPSGSYPVH